MATVDLQGNKRPAKALETGENVVLFRISLSTSWSSGDVHRIGRIPHGAIPTRAVLFPGTAIAGGTVAKFGTSANQVLFFPSATYSAAVYTSTNVLGYQKQISLSDDAMPRYENVVMVATAGVSVGYVGDLLIGYVLDQNPA